MLRSNKSCNNHTFERGVGQYGCRAGDEEEDKHSGGHQITGSSRGWSGPILTSTSPPPLDRFSAPVRATRAFFFAFCAVFRSIYRSDHVDKRLVHLDRIIKRIVEREKTAKPTVVRPLPLLSGIQARLRSHFFVVQWPPTRLRSSFIRLRPSTVIPPPAVQQLHCEIRNDLYLRHDIGGRSRSETIPEEGDFFLFIFLF